MILRCCLLGFSVCKVHLTAAVCHCVCVCWVCVNVCVWMCVCCVCATIATFIINSTVFRSVVYTNERVALMLLFYDHSTHHCCCCFYYCYCSCCCYCCYCCCRCHNMATFSLRMNCYISFHFVAIFHYCQLPRFNRAYGLCHSVCIIIIKFWTQKVHLKTVGNIFKIQEYSNYIPNYISLINTYHYCPFKFLRPNLILFFPIKLNFFLF